MDVLAKKLERLKKEKVEMEGASKGEVEQLKAETKEQQETLDAADIERRKMHNVIQVRVGPQVARVGWPEASYAHPENVVHPYEGFFLFSFLLPPPLRRR